MPQCRHRIDNREDLVSRRLDVAFKPFECLLRLDQRLFLPPQGRANLVALGTAALGVGRVRIELTARRLTARAEIFELLPQFG